MTKTREAEFAALMPADRVYMDQQANREASGEVMPKKPTQPAIPASTKPLPRKRRRPA
jgi:hypothetical protein